MIAKEYLLPVTGCMKDWRTFSGDPADPIRPVGYHEFLASRDREDEPSVMTVLEYFLDEGVAWVRVEASEEFHAAFDAWLSKRTPAKICQDVGRHQLRHSPHDPAPAISTRMAL